jgi:hypothetical protein
MLTASSFPGIKLVHEESSVRKMRRPSEMVRRPSEMGRRPSMAGKRRESRSWITALQTSVQPAQASTPAPSTAVTPSMHLDTELARKGSNFGLPIALQLTKVMGGAVGIVSVGCCHYSCSCCSWAATPLSLHRCIVATLSLLLPLLLLPLLLLLC